MTLAGMVLVLVGLGVVALAMFSGGRQGQTEVRGGGVVMVGPVPIIFGSDMRWASVAILLAIVLVLLTLLLYVM